MKTVSQPYRGPKLREKKSIFQATIYPVENETEIDTRLKEINDEFDDASHNAYAYRFLRDGKPVADRSDDGEVPNTAGQPILNILGNYEMINVLLIVSRYYGGINLGRGGLLRNYSQTAQDLLDNIPIVEFNN